ncbi:alcohol dehydrogenase [Ktedonosporobacter rubrisoli]|uniref:Alcohol dehydrogenase n=1 Tax=Ktedonosporobacter rubrisoli TaxID=2509675 RepID=A0A4P6JU22_KTERU|nr:zinc-dependent alcohol dehydrogenase family protein [Ktedonosporobacter rubrisoli]QBD78810.1 alcohol dehydrogenase [Ktedonosporobacter rubrisoli]
MRTRAAVLYEIEKPEPYATSQPLVIEEVELDPPGPGEVLVEIVGAGLCHSDLSAINGSIPRYLPMILGHEASGIVREIGPGVKDLQQDDHVVFSFVPSCGHCLYCAIGRPALCENGSRTNMAGTLLSGDVRFHKPDSQRILHYLGVSAFSQYTVVAQESLIKIEKSVPLDKAALFGCAVLTGVGAVINTARVAPGEPVAIFGLGGVGLSALMGARLAGASPIIAVDVLPAKFALAKRLGADFTLNANEVDPIVAIRDITGGGVEYAFEAVGNARVLTQAYRATRSGGKTISIGIPHPKQQLELQAISLVALEKAVLGSFMGSAVPRRDIPRLINLYLAGKLPVDELLSPAIMLEEINTGFDRLAQGSAIRQLLHFS